MAMTMTAHRTGIGHAEGIRTSTMSWRKVTARIGKAIVALQEWQERSRERRQLLSLGDNVLKDLGRTRCDAFSEARKRFWQA